MSGMQKQKFRNKECHGPKTGATGYHAQLKLQDKGQTVKGLVVRNNF